MRHGVMRIDVLLVAKVRLPSDWIVRLNRLRRRRDECFLFRDLRGVFIFYVHQPVCQLSRGAKFAVKGFIASGRCPWLA